MVAWWTHSGSDRCVCIPELAVALWSADSALGLLRKEPGAPAFLLLSVEFLLMMLAGREVPSLLAIRSFSSSAKSWGLLCHAKMLAMKARRENIMTALICKLDAFPKASRVMMAFAGLKREMFEVDRRTAESCLGSSLPTSFERKSALRTACVAAYPITPPSCLSCAIAPSETAVKSE